MHAFLQSRVEKRRVVELHSEGRERRKRMRREGGIEGNQDVGIAENE